MATRQGTFPANHPKSRFLFGVGGVEIKFVYGLKSPLAVPRFAGLGLPAVAFLRLEYLSRTLVKNLPPPSQFRAGVHGRVIPNGLARKRLRSSRLGRGLFQGFDFLDVTGL